MGLFRGSGRCFDFSICGWKRLRQERVARYERGTRTQEADPRDVTKTGAACNAFKKVLKERKSFQEKLFVQGSRNSLLLSVPLLREGKVEGILVLTFQPGDLKDQVGLTEEAFLAMDFNP
jgi:hypothetical protein